MAVRVATDVGGTFTDLAWLDESGDRVGFAKVPTTPHGFQRGVVDAIEQTGLDAAKVIQLVHGTTVVINAITERRGARVGVLTTRGMRDVLEIARGNRPDIYNLRYRKPPPFVERRFRLEVDERMDARGAVLRALDEEGVRGAARRLHAERVEAVAVCFLHAYANPDHELRAGEILAEEMPDAFITLSHEITREFREYERTNTAVLNSYVGPIAGQYLERLSTALQDTGIEAQPLVMQSNGGMTSAARAARQPIQLVESGPAAGVIGAVSLGKELGLDRLITLDVGGTTAKVSVVDGGTVVVTTDYYIERTPTWAGYPIKAPVVDILEIGSGGGSIAWIDEDGAVRVGPQSAGADPGPASYGRNGTQPTITDANLIAGRLNPDFFLGGAMRLDTGAARLAYSRFAQSLGLSVEDATRGVLRVAGGNMTNALKIVTVQRGYDPRDLTLIAMGGGGPIHAPGLARELRVRRVVVPVSPGHFSALGMLTADVRRDYLRTVLKRTDCPDVGQLQDVYQEMQEQARRELEEDGMTTGDPLTFSRQADMRYSGQEHTVHVDFPTGLIDAALIRELEARFHAEHRRRYTFQLESPIEVVNLHLVASVAQLRPVRIGPGHQSQGSPAGRRPVWFEDEGVMDTPIYRRSGLAPGTMIRGPAIIEEPASVLPVYPGMHIHVHELGELILELE